MAKTAQNTVIKTFTSQAPKVAFVWGIFMFLLSIIGLSDLINYPLFIQMLKGGIFSMMGYLALIKLLIRKGA